MLFDICRCSVSLTDQTALVHWNGVVHAILSHGQAAPQHLSALLDLAPQFAMGHAVRGLSALMLARREMVPVAQHAHQTALASLKTGANERERLWVVALGQWLDGRPEAAIGAIEACLKLNPADTISMKLSHGIRFMLGDNKGMLTSVAAVMDAHGSDHPLRGYARGCHAFALEETGEYAQAERVGLSALEDVDDDAWGLHAVAHVYEMTHLTAKGITLIDDNEAAWSHCNNFRFHVWWHKALLLLDQGKTDAALALYDAKIRSEKTDDYRDISNATSLLMRLELVGVDVGPRWQELADLSEARSNDGCLVFADLHYMLALTGDAREDAVARIIAQVARCAQGQGSAARVADAPGVAAAKGLAAFGAANYDDAQAYLASAQPLFQTIGGSHAQRDVFEQLTIEASLRAGRLDAAEELLAQRNSLRAGQEDAFASSRRAILSQARRAAAQVAAE